MTVFRATLVNFALTSCLLMSIPAAVNAALPQKWALDLPKTNVNFKVAYLGSGMVEGKFHKVNGTINYDVKQPTRTTINFTVDAKSVDTGRKIRDNFLRRKELLNSDKYPTMTFVSKKVSMINDKEANVTGNFTVLGQTKPLTIRVKLSNVENDPATKQPILKFRATGLIDRFDYGVTAFPKVVGNMIPLDISGNLVAAS